MSKLITIPIRKHTKVRRLSRWTLYLDPLLDTGKFITRPITDISKGLENPLTTDRLQRKINDFKRMYPTPYPIRKPSLLTKLKNRFKK